MIQRSDFSLPSSGGYIRVILLPLSYAALANAKYRYGATPLWAAVRNGHEVVRLLFPLIETAAVLEDPLKEIVVSRASTTRNANIIDLKAKWPKTIGTVENFTYRTCNQGNL